MTRPNDAAPRPSACKDDHPLTWKSEDLAFCTDRETGSTEPVIRFWAWEDGELVAIERHEFISVGFWEVQVGSLLNTTDPAIAAERVRALIDILQVVASDGDPRDGCAHSDDAKAALAPLKDASA